MSREAAGQTVGGIRQVIVVVNDRATALLPIIFSDT